MFRAIGIIAEQRICEAMEKGEFDNLEGSGKPLDLASDANIPEELRMAWKLLKNAGYAQAEPAAGQPFSVEDFLSGNPDEQRQVLAMRKCGVLLSRMGLDESRRKQLEDQPEYFSRIVSRVPVARKEER